MQCEFKQKIACGVGSGAEAALKPTKKEGPHKHVAATLLKPTKKEGTCTAKREAATPLKPTNKEGPHHPPSSSCPKATKAPQLKGTLRRELD